ncbi:3-deoxy-manno-octulosonate cytidylyltransferase [Parvularcula marina]|uniref:3-deoxy-manno-octulosonate cytidylyltransferase n=1 Tax=Parvularcula marina TaxID=2292771 RepID=A0A371RH33_9PROT|nr:3-deoxy-manno-octulosonate cytidylyltransferase [Parvularcula marina]RFB04768.1 3-deoxy-manno-octulosonate cytidylyltransferase [Parvularcula marina]
MTRALIVIPARYASSRLPGKPLLAETGKPLIQHTVEQAMKVNGVEVVVATDDERIIEAVNAFGGNAVMTDPAHQSGTDRVAEAARGHDAEIIVNVQGDEPEIDPEVISLLIETHAAAQTSTRPAFTSTLVCPFPEDTDPAGPNAVKAVLSAPDDSGVRSALYFSRSLIPYPRSGEARPFLHLGLYAFTKESLQAFPTLSRTPLEQTESLEQLRILEHGHRIACGVVREAAPGIDTPEDYAGFVKRQAAL